MGIRLLNDFVLVRKDYVDHVRNDGGDVLLYHTDITQDTTNFAEVIDVGPDCKYATKSDIGKHAYCPEWEDGMFRVGACDWAIREDLIQFLIED